MGKSMKLSLIILVSIMVSACQSQGDLARTRVSKYCSNLSIPEGAKVTDQDYILHRTRYYVLFDKYANLAVHSGKLADCGQSLVCAVKTTEWERDCKDNTNTFWYRVSGFRPECTIPVPDC